MPAGHGPGKSIEKFGRKFRPGAASNLNKRNGDAQYSNSVIPSSHHTAAHKNREIWKSRTARRGRSSFSPTLNTACIPQSLTKNRGVKFTPRFSPVSCKLGQSLLVTFFCHLLSSVVSTCILEQNVFCGRMQCETSRSVLYR